MELILLETNFDALDIIDTFESLIWVDKYSENGDFEVLIPVNANIVSKLVEDRYLKLRDSDHLMVIEDLSIDSDFEDGTKLLVKGRSIEIILERRRVFPPMLLQGSLELAIQSILNDNIITPTNADRQISNFIFELSGDSVIEAKVVDDQFGPDYSVYDAIRKICSSNGIGFKVTLNESGQFVFKLYLGVDRSYDQVINPYVIFSQKFENIQNGSYRQTNLFERNVDYVSGEKGIGNESMIVVVAKADAIWTGLNRREMYTDASSITRNVPNEVPLTEAEYIDKLAQKGKQDLYNNSYFQAFDGQIDTLGLYIYNLHYGMGDIVEVADEYDHEARSRITEIIFSEDTTGIRKYPTFRTIG